MTRPGATTSDDLEHSEPRELTRALTIAAVAAASAGLFVLLTRAVSRRVTAEADAALLERIAPEDEQIREAAEALHPIGKWWSYVPAAVAIAPVVIGVGRGPLTRRIAGACSIVSAALISAAVNPGFDQWLPQPDLPPGRRDKPKPSFPSGHTFGLGSLTITATYVLAREEILPSALLIPIAAAIPLAAGGARMLEEKHWPTDVIGGALVAITIAAVVLAVQESVV